MHTHTALAHMGGFLWEHYCVLDGEVHVDLLIIKKKTATEGIISQANLNPCFRHNVYVFVEDRRTKGRKRWRAAADSYVCRCRDHLQPVSH